MAKAVFQLLVSMVLQLSPWLWDFVQYWFHHGVPFGEFQVQDLILPRPETSCHFVSSGRESDASFFSASCPLVKSKVDTHLAFLST